MNKKLTDKAVQVCIDVFENSTLEEIINLSSRLDEVWKIGKKIKENIDFEEEFDYDNFIYVDGKCFQLEIKSDGDCLQCVFQNYFEGECHHGNMCPGEGKYISFK